MKKLPIILVISLLLISLAPACIAADIKIKPTQWHGYEIVVIEGQINERGDIVTIPGIVINTRGHRRSVDVVAWAVDSYGHGDEIARYRESLGYLDKGDAKRFTVSFLKTDKWEDAKWSLTVYIKIE